MEIYKGIATGKCDNESLVDFLNYVFGFNGNKIGFHKLLPKLYKPEYRPEDHNFIVTEDGRLRAAVGAYPFALNVAGVRLNGIGIGNVAVHPMHRSKGYMKDCMKLALDHAMKNADFADLGGRRQRYSYFGFEPAGVCGSFGLEKHNLRHVYGSENGDPNFTAKELTENDTAEIEQIKTLSYSHKYYPVRDNASYFDILSSWCEKVYFVTTSAGEFAGYFTYCDEEGTITVMELDCTKPEYAAPVLRACAEAAGANYISVNVPEFNEPFFYLLSDIAEGVSFTNSEHFSVYNYKKVVAATLDLKASYTDLCDGSLSIDIDGVAGREKLLISVKDGVPSVTEYDGECDLKFSHRQAMGVMFALSVPEKRQVPAFAKGWFPLPLVTLGADNS